MIKEFSVASCSFIIETTFFLFLVESKLRFCVENFNLINFVHFWISLRSKIKIQTVLLFAYLFIAWNIKCSTKFYWDLFFIIEFMSIGLCNLWFINWKKKRGNFKFSSFIYILQLTHGNLIVPMIMFNDSKPISKLVEESRIYITFWTSILSKRKFENFSTK